MIFGLLSCWSLAASFDTDWGASRAGGAAGIPSLGASAQDCALQRGHAYGSP